MTRKRFLGVALMWLAWLVITLVFQELVPARLQLRPPDYALSWTPNETRPRSQNDKPYLIEPFLNSHVAWDSEFYLSIATAGYDDPKVRAVTVRGKSATPVDPASLTPPLGDSPDNRPLSLNYAFMPLYSLVTRLVALPVQVLGLNPIAAGTLAGVIVSALGALAAMIALYDIAQGELGEAGGLRAAFYLVVFPTGFFLAQVYTEGLFVGLAFGSIALARRKQWVWAALLAVLATWTRAVGVALVIPLAWGLWNQLRTKEYSLRPLDRRLVLHAILTVLPIAAYLAWHYSFWGQAFGLVEGSYFSRGLFLIGQSLSVWGQAFGGMFGSNTQATAYYLMEVLGIVVGLVATALTLRRYPDIALFGLAVLVVSFTSGVPQGMLRYVIAMPAIFIALSRLGKNAVFDRSWTFGSILLQSIVLIMFTFDMWAG
ncbi:MAG: hypothetical protein QOH93_2894 [Chloroflexia bacterium]|jgi:hypothetical protein|nr:hypothetical protein [Chloroflexia bacterium]